MTYRMAELTATTLRERLAQRPVLLLPLGSFEDQGPHAPMGDYLSADALALRIAGAAGVPALVAPVLPFGGADFFAPVPGAIALGQATLRGVLSDMLGCLLRHGLTRLLLLNGHGGNAGAIHDVTLRLRHETGHVIPSFYLWREAGRLLPKVVDAAAAQRSAGHGADPLASIAWHLFPELMRPELIPAPMPGGEMLGLPVSGFGTVRHGAVEIDVPVEIDAIAPGGVAGGDARLCSPETGAALAQLLVAEGAALVAHLWQQAEAATGG